MEYSVPGKAALMQSVRCILKIVKTQLPVGHLTHRPASLNLTPNIGNWLAISAELVSGDVHFCTVKGGISVTWSSQEGYIRRRAKVQAPK